MQWLVGEGWSGSTDLRQSLGSSLLAAKTVNIGPSSFYPLKELGP